MRKEWIGFGKEKMNDMENLLGTDQEIQKNSKAFLEWANQYENDDF